MSRGTTEGEFGVAEQNEERGMMGGVGGGAGGGASGRKLGGGKL